MKKTIIWLLVASFFVVTGEGFARFEDDREIPDWALNSVDLVQDRKIMTGFGDGTFRPNQTLNRAEAVTLLMRVKGIDPSEYEVINTFSDVPTDSWFAPAVTVAVQNDWVKGYPDYSFKPGNKLNRAEWAVILHRAFNFRDEHEDSGHNDVPSRVWFSDSVNALHANDMIRRRTKDFSPEGAVSRAEAAWQIAVLLGKPRLLGTSSSNDFSSNVANNSRRVAIKPRDFDANDQGFDIDPKEVMVQATSSSDTVSFAKTSGWVDLGSFTVANRYDVKSWFDTVEFRFWLDQSGMGPSDSFELKITNEYDFERIESFTRNGKVFIPSLYIELAPKEERTYQVAIRALEGQYFFPSIAKGSVSVSEITGLTQKALTSSNAREAYTQVNARVTIEETKIADIEFDPNK